VVVVALAAWEGVVLVGVEPVESGRSSNRT